MTDPRVRDVIHKLAITRHEKKLTQETAAARIPVSRETLARWENFTTEPTFSRLLEYADAVGLQVDISFPSTARAA